jgi:hypothetical protein
MFTAVLADQWLRTFFRYVSFLTATATSDRAELGSIRTVLTPVAFLATSATGTREYAWIRTIRLVMAGNHVSEM